MAEKKPSVAEIRAINEKLLIAAIRQQELAEAAIESAGNVLKNTESALKTGELYRQMARNFPNGIVLLFDHDLRHILADGRGLVALELSQKILEGRTVWESFAPQDSRQIELAYRAALAGETTVSEVLFPAGANSKGNGERVYQLHTVPVMDDRGNIVAGMAVAQDVTERRQAEEAIRWQAHHDALTGLPNRVLLRDRLDQVLAMSKRSDGIAALLFLDLDHFKQVNDTLGHDVGDRLLQHVAACLTGCLRAEDTAARIGGDEFVVILPGLQSAGDAATVVQKIAARLAATVHIDGHEMSVNVSVGISLFPIDGRDAATLMKRADAAMYQSKQDHYTGLRPYVDLGAVRPTETDPIETDPTEISSVSR